MEDSWFFFLLRPQLTPTHFVRPTYSTSLKARQPLLFHNNLYVFNHWVPLALNVWWLYKSFHLLIHGHWEKKRTVISPIHKTVPDVHNRDMVNITPTPASPHMPLLYLLHNLKSNNNPGITSMCKHQLWSFNQGTFTVGLLVSDGQFPVYIQKKG